MTDSNIQDIPKMHTELVRKSEEIGFTMPSDLYVGSFLKTLIASKPSGRFLEIGTGIGLSLSWMIEGMDNNSKLISVDNDQELTEIANSYFGNDKRIELICKDGSQWIKEYAGENFDLIFEINMLDSMVITMFDRCAYICLFKNCIYCILLRP